MIVTLRVPDELQLKYGGGADKTPSKAMEETLARFADIKLDDRVVMLSGDARKRIEAALGRDVSDTKWFADQIEAITAMHAEGARIQFSASQRLRLEAEARFYKRSFEAHVKDRVEQMLFRELGK